MEWYAHVEGHEHDLELLVGEIRGPEPSIRKEGDEYQLRSQEFKSGSTSTEVRLKAEELLTIAVEAAAVGQLSRLRAEIGQVTLVDDDGHKHHFVAIGAELVIRSRARATLSGGEVPKETIGEKVLRLARTNEHVRIAAHFLNVPATWVDLYKVYDAINEARGGEAQLVNPGVSKAKLRNFRQTANNRSAVGDAARHAQTRMEPPDKPMTLGEADGLMRRLFDDYLESLP